MLFHLSSSDSSAKNLRLYDVCSAVIECQRRLATAAPFASPSAQGGYASKASEAGEHSEMKMACMALASMALLNMAGRTKLSENPGALSRHADEDDDQGCEIRPKARIAALEALSLLGQQWQKLAPELRNFSASDLNKPFNGSEGADLTPSSTVSTTRSLSVIPAESCVAGRRCWYGCWT